MTEALSAGASGMRGGHVPVLLGEVLEILAPRDGGIYVDGTFGAGGYSRALLEAARCTVWGIDRDRSAALRGAEMARRYRGRLTVLAGRFGEMDRLLEDHRVSAVDGVALDLGVSSTQIDDPARGFSFRSDGPLDMRMGEEGPSAAELVNRLAEGELARIIRDFGEERFGRQVARAIVTARAKAPIATTGHLAAIVRSVVRAGADGIDPATRTFQALRIEVNDELGELDRGLAAAERLLKPGGRLAVVAFHSLEDRRVKRFMKGRSAAGRVRSRLLPGERPECPASFRLITKKPIRPGEGELAANPRARSARLRAAERTAAPPWSAEPAS
ncbi:MAG TPA: 16S rRNA (cytosine(1402)-N(4))-methyltransferase RsmH [Alphaproteobacteria bacterium]|nr:16S rRNA (cytosine(1402)-N(4))-methyltransferase RsmH [Alphaproteobacteria bacterium]